MLEVHVLAFAEEHERDQGFLVAIAPMSAKPTQRNAMTMAAFCPPSSRLPNGRARKLAAKVTKASSVASIGSDLATSVKKMSPK